MIYKKHFYIIAITMLCIFQNTQAMLKLAQAFMKNKVCKPVVFRPKESRFKKSNENLLRLCKFKEDIIQTCKDFEEASKKLMLVEKELEKVNKIKKETILRDRDWNNIYQAAYRVIFKEDDIEPIIYNCLLYRRKLNRIGTILNLNNDSSDSSDAFVMMTNTKFRKLENDIIQTCKGF